MPAEGDNVTPKVPNKAQKLAQMAAICVLSWSCTGVLPEGPERPGQTNGVAASQTGDTPQAPGSTSTAVLARCTTPAVGPTALRRLTHEQYDNAVHDLLGTETKPGRELARGTEQGLFDSMADQDVAPLLADQYLDAALSLAEGVRDIKVLLGCDPVTGATCVRDFIKRFGRRAFRRPLTAQEVDDLSALHDKTRLGSDANTGVRAVIAAMLVSPNFLFMPEFGGDPASLPHAKLAAPFELSARLAWLLWSSVPDDALLDAAANGQLTTAEQVATQARRMLDDPRARSGVLAFFEQWFGLALLTSATKDPTVYPGFDPTLREAMGEETRRFVQHVLWNDDAKLKTLLTAPFSFVNGPLAKLYGVATPSDSNFSKVTLDSKQRSGILTQASFLTTFAASNASSPVKRGKWLRTRMLCQELPEPPANVPPLPPPKQGTSTRERFAEHTSNPGCSSCHKLIDGLGFGLEAYDGVGAFRTTDLGVAVDTSGTITNTSDIDGSYAGAPELAAKLSQSKQVQGCAPLQWFRFAFGRREDTDDACSIEAIQTAFDSSDGNLKELMVALTQSDAFLHYRQPE